jgi:hypothetical protein
VQCTYPASRDLLERLRSEIQQVAYGVLHHHSGHDPCRISHGSG